ncbi:MAG: tetratricopeptide repeat protein, partial [Terriglobia bacterium]
MTRSFGSKIRISALCSAGSTLLLLSGCSVSPAQYVEKGTIAVNAGSYAEAQIDFEKAIQKDSNFGEAYFRLGRLQLRQADAGEAFRNLSAAVQLLP